MKEALSNGPKLTDVLCLVYPEDANRSRCRNVVCSFVFFETLDDRQNPNIVVLNVMCYRQKFEELNV